MKVHCPIHKPDGDILHSRTVDDYHPPREKPPPEQNWMDGLEPHNWPRCWRENNRSELHRIREDIRHMTGLQVLHGKDGTLRAPMTLGELRTSLLCTLNIMSDLISYLEAKDGQETAKGRS